MIRAATLAAVSSEVQDAIDKVSMDEQDRANTEYCRKHDYHIIKKLEIRGHSRYNPDLPLLLEEYRRLGVSAFDDLADLWRNRKLDVLVAYHPSRLGRNEPLFHWITSNIMAIGGRVEFVHGGLIDSPIAAAMGGIVAPDSVNKLVADKRAGMKKRAERGLKTGSAVPYFHKEKRDKNGHALPLSVDRRRYQRLIDDLYDLVVNQHTAWDKIEAALEERGHWDKDGGHFAWHAFYHIVRTPPFWGHVSTGYSAHDKRTDSKIHKSGLWQMNESEAHNVPAGVTIHYNVCESVYQDYERAMFLNEVRISILNSQGRIERRNRNAFSGLLRCEECGTAMVFTGNGAHTYRGYRCNIPRLVRRGYKERACTQRQSIPFAKVQKWFDRNLRYAIEHSDANAFLVQSDPVDYEKRERALKSELSKLNKRITNLLERIADLPAAATADASNLIMQYTVAREQIETQLRNIHSEHFASQQRKDEVTLSLEQIAAYGMDNFWNQSETDIHSQLHMLMGKLRLTILDGEITGTVMI